jgi:arrestin-related trafficking adapter 4/5/7
VTADQLRWSTYSTSSINGVRPNSKERTFFEKSWTFREAAKNKTETMKPDNYEFPFDFILEGQLPESIEGLKSDWVIYRFKAEIGRKYAKDIIIRRPLRVVRTLDASALGLSHAMVSFLHFSSQGCMMCVHVNGLSKLWKKALSPS